MPDVKLLIDQLGDAPFPNATALAREAYLQQSYEQDLRRMLSELLPKELSR